MSLHGPSCLAGLDNHRVQPLGLSPQEPARGSAGLVEVLMKASSLLPYAVLASAVLSL